MLKERSQFLQRALFGADLLLIVVAWIGAYYVRFLLFYPPHPTFLAPFIQWLPLRNNMLPPLDEYLRFLPVVMVLWGMLFSGLGLYRGDRSHRLPVMTYSIARAVLFGTIVVLAVLFFYRSFSFSRSHLLIFSGMSLVLMIGTRLVVYFVAHRRRTRDRRRVLIVGAGVAGRRLAQAFRRYPWMGFDVVGFLDDYKQTPDVLGPTEDTVAIVDRFNAQNQPIDYVYLALPLKQTARIESLLDELSTRLAHVYLVPDLFQFDILHSRVSDIEGLPVIHIFDEAPMAFRRVFKRGLDIIFSSGLLLLTSPLLLVIALAVKLSSPGPVLFKQERMSLNGQHFNILKFRTMPIDAEHGSGPVWATEGGKRATRLGRFLRTTSLDELPQFFNVLRGDMSVVGPRPERPVFIEEFKDHVPRYMLRHKVKAGITGWAQVNGWRGDTSIHKRIEYDMYYIQHWSLRLDFKIMWMTLWTGFVHDNAY